MVEAGFLVVGMSLLVSKKSWNDPCGSRLEWRCQFEFMFKLIEIQMVAHRKIYRYVCVQGLIYANIFFAPQQKG